MHFLNTQFKLDFNVFTSIITKQYLFLFVCVRFKKRVTNPKNKTYRTCVKIKPDLFKMSV